jgi:aspartyl-tRNA(Asn)/glutamyl-tRNA(Gln) amidotransferase subunit C
MDTRELETTAALAQIELREGDLARLGDAVSQMLAYFETMNALNTEGLEPTTHALVKDNRVRSDDVAASDFADALIDQAPEREDRFIVIPNVL